MASHALWERTPYSKEYDQHVDVHTHRHLFDNDTDLVAVTPVCHNNNVCRIPAVGQTIPCAIRAFSTSISSTGNAPHIKLMGSPSIKHAHGAVCSYLHHMAAHTGYGAHISYNGYSPIYQQAQTSVYKAQGTPVDSSRQHRDTGAVWTPRFPGHCVKDKSTTFVRHMSSGICLASGFGRTPLTIIKDIKYADVAPHVVPYGTSPQRWSAVCSKTRNPPSKCIAALKNVLSSDEVQSILNDPSKCNMIRIATPKPVHPLTHSQLERIVPARDVKRGRKSTASAMLPARRYAHISGEIWIKSMKTGG